MLLSRHGVRAPPTNAELDSRSATPWPTWPVPPGFPDAPWRGAAAPDGSVLPGALAVDAGWCSRTIVRHAVRSRHGPISISARGERRGVAHRHVSAPRPSTSATRDDPTVPDPLFHPQPTVSCPMDGRANRAAVLARIGGNFTRCSASTARNFADGTDLSARRP